MILDDETPIPFPIKPFEGGQIRKFASHFEGEAGEAIEWRIEPKMKFLEAVDIAMPIAVGRANEQLPPNTRFEIRCNVPSDYGRLRGLAWYRFLDLDAVEPWVFPPERAIDYNSRRVFVPPEGGYFLLGRFTTPARN